jgi:HAD superfamily hydrolase (TIGR01509 family)
MRFDAVLFDCDGVLVDSEPITNGVLREMLAELGWVMSVEECMRRFVGKALKDDAAEIEAHTGRPVTEAWLAEFRARRDAQLRERVGPIPGAVEAVRQVHADFAGRIACCTGADRPKAELQLTRCGMMDLFQDRLYSGHDMPRSKPAPDVYLAAIRRFAVDAGRCAVVEDTVTGVRAGVAAGCVVFGYCPDEPGHGGPQALLDAGAAQLFTRMADLPGLLK